MAIEYRSQQTWRGMPLVHVAFGPRRLGIPRQPGHARGVIAVGDRAVGIVAVGAVALGVIAVGPVAIGLAAVGAVAVGVVATGAVAVGLARAIGGVTAGGGASR